ncbi:unnamed protein product [Schistocephalus solidus]|uniref:LITAF domain-containing protein n=1 Tax=Schistocephalus solidus TaxID=70667 RepID=A0A183SSI4_SCHSO|nr:unnamed protein product [Schistocephalus solidus]
MDLFGHMHIHDSGIHRDVDNTDAPCTPPSPAYLTATSIPTTTNDKPPAPLDFFCPHCARNFTSRIGLSVTCESIPWKLANQCLGLRRTVDAPASTAFTAPAHSHTAWAY